MYIVKLTSTADAALTLNSVSTAFRMWHASALDRGLLIKGPTARAEQNKDLRSCNEPMASLRGRRSYWRAAARCCVADDWPARLEKVAAVRIGRARRKCSR